MNKIILNTDAEAAKFVEHITGWVSREGRFYGKDERIARWDGCTHIMCEDCGTPTPKARIVCGVCSDKRAAARYDKLELAEWDGKGMIYSCTADRFFSSWDEVAEYIEDKNEETLIPEVLRLVVCDPIFLSEVDVDMWCDELPEDGELPAVVAAALHEFNKVIRSYGPVSWTPGKKAVSSII